MNLSCRSIYSEVNADFVLKTRFFLLDVFKPLLRVLTSEFCNADWAQKKLQTLKSLNVCVCVHSLMSPHVIPCTQRLLLYQCSYVIFLG